MAQEDGLHWGDDIRLNKFMPGGEHHSPTYPTPVLELPSEPEERPWSYGAAPVPASASVTETRAQTGSAPSVGQTEPAPDKKSTSSSPSGEKRFNINPKDVAALALGAVIVFAGVEGVKGVERILGDIGSGIEHIFHGIGGAFTPQVDVKKESQAAVDRVTIPDDTIEVSAHGHATTTTSVSVKCPSLMSLACDAIPRAHNGVVPYMDVQSRLTADNEVVIGEKAWQLSTEVDENGNPYTIATISTDYIHTQLSNAQPTQMTHNYLTQNLIDLFNLQTAHDQILQMSADTTKAAAQQTCQTPLYQALPAGIAKTVHAEELSMADGLVAHKDSKTAYWLKKLAAAPVLERFTGAALRLNGGQPALVRNVTSGNVNVANTLQPNCQILAAASSDIKALMGQEGHTFNIDPSYPLLAAAGTKTVEYPNPIN